MSVISRGTLTILASALLLSATAAQASPDPANDAECEIVFSVDSDGSLASLGWSVDYSAAPGRIAGSGSTPACVNLVPDGLSSFTDDDEGRELLAELTVQPPAENPRELARCLFQGDDVPLASEFDAFATFASDADLQLVDPLPRVEVTSIDCADREAATTAELLNDQSDWEVTGTSNRAVASTTTSTTNPLDLSCRVVFVLEDDVTAGALQFDVDYSDVPGTLPGSGSSAQCAKLIPSALFALTDVDATETVIMGFVDLDGMSGPNLDLAQCQFQASATPLKSDFAITVTDATDASDDGLPIEPVPSVKVGLIECDGGEPTTTLPVVTTTTTTMIGGGGPRNYDIMFTLATASQAVASLQFEVNYAAATGGFEGTGAFVKCTKQVVTALFAPNDVEATSTLTLGLVDLNGFSAPRDVAKCTFNGDAGDPPVPGDFIVTIVDSSNVEGDRVSSTVQVSVAGSYTEFCGDGVKSTTEACDDGNASNADACLNNCTLARCGDGVVRTGVEACDDGNAVNTDACLNTCVAATCGDGTVRTGVEACDDGNAINNDACLNTCAVARCGDGVVRTGTEACDDGNLLNTDACLDTCVAAKCGDGYLRTGVETCDDGNAVNTDACLNTCVAARCGDGYLRTGVETCDDGNAVNTDACLNTCVAAKCGDGYLRTGVETCDDGNAVNTDACPATCAPARCGDGFVRSGVEACDDGNSSNIDACLTTCVAAKCGDGYIRTGVEECDDANSVDQDGCSPVCLAGPLCSDPTGDGRVLVGDVLRILQRGVGLSVECPDWTCDPNGDGRVTAPDALVSLNASVGLPVVWKCPPPSAVVLSVTSVSTLGGLQLDLDYDDVLADLVGDGALVQCQGLVPGGLFVFNNKPARVLSMSMVVIDGFTGPRDIARCKLTPWGIVKKAAFVPKIVDAISPAGAPVSGVQVKAVPY